MFHPECRTATRRISGWLRAAAAIVALLGTPQALAATYIVPTDDVLIGKADVIVRGWVDDVVSVETSTGSIETRVTLAIDRALKGNGLGRTLVIRQPGGQVGDRIERYPGIGSFHQGEEVLLMLDVNREGDYRLTWFGLGKFSVRIANDGTKLLRRDALSEALLLPGTSTVAVQGGSTGADPDRDAAGFERYIEDRLAGRVSAVGWPISAGYAVPPGASVDPSSGGLRTDFELFAKPARWVKFSKGDSVKYKDNSTGDPGTNCPSGCHAEVAAGVQAWNGAPGALISVLYGGTDSTIGTKGLQTLQNQIQFDDPHDELTDLVGCTGLFAVGGYSAKAGAGGTGCADKGNPTFDKITSGRIVVNNGTGSCMDSCDYTDVIAHETGHSLGAENSFVPGALMSTPHGQTGRCGVLQADDIAFADCVYAGSSTCTPAVVATVIPKMKNGLLRAVIQGSGFRKGATVEIDAGAGFVPATLTVFKKKAKVVGKDVEAIWPVGVPVDVHVMSATGCASNSVTVTR